MKYVRRFFFAASLILFLFNGVDAYPREIIKILAIGNSFSEDAVEDYLDDLARATGIKVTIGNACIGGCTLEKHWYNALHDSTNYSYRKISPDGEKSVTPKNSLLSCITDEDWDYITFQQNSGLSGQPETYSPYLLQLVNYVKKHATNPDVKPAFHQTWAYAQDSKHARFANYGENQYLMYRAIIEAVNRATAEAGISLIIPAGTTIQNARLNLKRDDLCRDGYHLEKITGRYLAACAWFETLLGKSVVNNPFYPEGISKEEAYNFQQSAYYAVMRPNTTTNFLLF